MRPLGVVFGKEVRESLRDRRVLLNAFLLAPLLGPVLFVVLIHAMSTRELEKAERPLPVTVIGGERAPNLVEALRQSRIEVQPPIADPEQAIRDQRIELALRIPDDYGRDFQAGRVAQVELLYDSSRREGGPSVARLRGALEGYGARVGAMRLVMRGLSPVVARPLVVADRDQATPQARGALLFAMLPYMLVLAALLGGMFLAIDATAGERERQSLEPLLVNPVARGEILLGKVLAASAFSTASVCMSLLAFSLAARFVPTEALDMTLDLGPGFAALALPVMLPLVFLLSVLQTLVSSYARSFREAQTLLGLLQLVPVIPSMLVMVLPFRPETWMYAVPLLGQQLLVLRMLRAEPVGAVPLLLCVAVTALAGVLLFLLARRLYGSERLAVST